METRCPTCGKKAIMAVKRKLLRGHYNPTTKHKQYPNLQWAKVPFGKNTKRMQICTDCIKTLIKLPA